MDSRVTSPTTHATMSPANRLSWNATGWTTGTRVASQPSSVTMSEPGDPVIPSVHAASG